VERIVALEERHLDAIEIVNAIYKEKEWEYSKRGFKQYPIIDDLYSFARALLDGTRGECTGREGPREDPVTCSRCGVKVSFVDHRNGECLRCKLKMVRDGG
jgi:hypothetical protein